MRRSGLEPEFRRWQRLVITTTLSAHFADRALQDAYANIISISNQGPHLSRGVEILVHEGLAYMKLTRF